MKNKINTNQEHNITLINAGSWKPVFFKETTPNLFFYLSF